MEVGWECQLHDFSRTQEWGGELRKAARKRQLLTWSEGQWQELGKNTWPLTTAAGGNSYQLQVPGIKGWMVVPGWPFSCPMGTRGGATGSNRTFHLPVHQQHYSGGWKELVLSQSVINKYVIYKSSWGLVTVSSTTAPQIYHKFPQQVTDVIQQHWMSICNN